MFSRSLTHIDIYTPFTILFSKSVILSPNLLELSIEAERFGLGEFEKLLKPLLNCLRIRSLKIKYSSAILAQLAFYVLAPIRSLKVFKLHFNKNAISDKISRQNICKFFERS